jgi:heterodisulfide reductase subunit A-like polyferredoxin
MYTNKQTIIAKEHSEKPLDTAVFFMDMRTHGKEFEKYYMRARDEKGVRLSGPRCIPSIRWKTTTCGCAISPKKGELVEETFDMVVLAVGLAPNKESVDLAKTVGIDLNEHLHAATRTLEPVSSSRPGVFVCGAFQEPKDIPQSVMEASAAASTATRPLAEARGSLIKTKELPPEIDVSGSGTPGGRLCLQLRHQHWRRGRCAGRAESMPPPCPMWSMWKTTCSPAARTPRTR